MKEKFEELYNFMRKNQKISEWAQQQTLRQRAEELQKEVVEMMTEIDNNDDKKFKEEVGDVLWDVLSLLVKAEEEGKLTLKELLHDVHQKFRKRKPFIEEGRKVTKEEETKIWHETKKKEKPT